MTAAQVVQMSVTVNNSPIQDYTLPDDNLLVQIFSDLLEWLLG